MKYGRISLIVIAALSASLALADDFKTTAGKEYKNATVSRVESDGIVIKFHGGIAKIFFVELPKEVQQRFHYDAEKPAFSSVTAVPDPAKWVYSESPDQMGRGTTKAAQVISSNVVHFGFPYEGETHAVLKLRKGSKGRTLSLRWNAGNSFHPPERLRHS